MVPLALALRARGHELLWATGPDGRATLERLGIGAVTAGLSQREALGEFARRHPEINALPPPERPDVMFGKLFAETIAPATLDDLLPVAKSWQPELVVGETSSLAAPLAARVVGVPHVTHAFGALIPAVRVRRGGEEVAPLWRAQGLEPPPYGGLYDHVYLDIYPPSLQPPGGEHLAARALLRPVAFAGAADTAHGDISERTGRPLVYLTFGTVFNKTDVFRTAVEGLLELGVGLVITVGRDGDPAAFGPLPPRVVVERYIPQTQILPVCDVVVSHGGSGTVLAALSMGIPQLCLPQAADQFLNAPAVARAGAGLAIPPDQVDAAAVAGATRQLLQDPAYRRSAQSVAEEIARMPAPEEVAPLLEALCTAPQRSSVSSERGRVMQTSSRPSGGGSSGSLS
jgi:UDP:flavonoid glycosyltransferase YjiC (YdhE family)